MCGARVLVVDDNEAAAGLLDWLLEDLGYEVIGPVNSGETALRVADWNAPTLVLMDLNLAGSLDGLSTAKLLQQRDGALPVIFMTGEDDPERLTQVQRLPNSMLVRKPFSFGQLATAMEAAVPLAA